MTEVKKDIVEKALGCIPEDKKPLSILRAAVCTFKTGF